MAGRALSAESECRDQYEWRPAGSQGAFRTEIVKPDGYFRLAPPGPQAHYDAFVELDLGHVSARVFQAKLEAYARYRKVGAFRQAYGSDRFAVLTVTTGRKRMQNLLLLAEECGIDFLLVATFPFVAEHGLLAPIWCSPGTARAASPLPETPTG